MHPQPTRMPRPPRTATNAKTFRKTVAERENPHPGGSGGTQKSGPPDHLRRAAPHHTRARLTPAEPAPAPSPPPPGSRAATNTTPHPPPPAAGTRTGTHTGTPTPPPPGPAAAPGTTCPTPTTSAATPHPAAGRAGGHVPWRRPPRATRRRPPPPGGEWEPPASRDAGRDTCVCARQRLYSHPRQSSGQVTCSGPGCNEHPGPLTLRSTPDPGTGGNGECTTLTSSPGFSPGIPAVPLTRHLGGFPLHCRLPGRIPV